jgi:hypothetical protein
VRTPRWMAAASLAALLAACTPSPTSDGASSPDAQPTATASPSPTTDGAVAPDPPPTSELLAFSGRQLDGGTFDGAAVTGDVVVWFWTPW